MDTHRPYRLSYRLNIDRFEQLTDARGWTTDIKRARGIGVSHTTISRIRSGEYAPGLRFIGLATAKLDVDIDDLFVRVDEPARAA